MPSLQQGRYRPSVCTLDNKIFVLAGDNITCEMMDLSDDDPEWRYIAKMNSKYYGNAVVVERKIYVMGSVTTDVDVYDVNQDQWNNVTNIPISRLSPDVSALGNKIYVTGG